MPIKSEQESGSICARFGKDPDFLSRVVTQDETWVHFYDPETKQQSMEWKHDGSPRLKKFRVQKSAGKVLASVFWNIRGVNMIDYLEKGGTITGEYYSKLLTTLRRKIKERKRGMLAKVSTGVTGLLHHSDRIIGGEIAQPGQFPYLVSIKSGPGIIGHICSGNIINTKWIITTAHCVSNKQPEDIFILADTVLLDSGGTNYSVSSIFTHPDYNSYKYFNDIALIEIQDEFRLSATTKVVEIGTSLGNESCIVEYPNELHYAHLTSLSDDDCTRLAQGGFMVIERGPGQMCAFGGQGIAPCYADSGDPLVCGDKLVGVVSYAISPCAKGYPDVYVRVGYYIQWITAIIVGK